MSDWQTEVIIDEITTGATIGDAVDVHITLCGSDWVRWELTIKINGIILLLVLLLVVLVEVRGGRSMLGIRRIVQRHLARGLPNKIQAR